MNYQVFKLKKPHFCLNFEANFEKCYHQYSKRYVIRKKSDDTCVNPKIKHRIHEGMWQVLYILNLEAFNFRYNISFIDPPLGGFGEILPSVMINVTLVN